MAKGKTKANGESVNDHNVITSLELAEGVSNPGMIADFVKMLRFLTREMTIVERVVQVGADEDGKLWVATFPKYIVRPNATAK